MSSDSMRLSNKTIAILFIVSVFAIMLGSLTAFYVIIQLTDKTLSTWYKLVYSVLLILDLVCVVMLFGYIYKIIAQKTKDATYTF